VIFGEQLSDPASYLFALVSGGNQVPVNPSLALGYAMGYVSPSRTFGVLSAGLGGRKRTCWPCVLVLKLLQFKLLYPWLSQC
jgi:hypothetical protein